MVRNRSYHLRQISLLFRRKGREIIEKENCIRVREEAVEEKEFLYGNIIYKENVLNSLHELKSAINSTQDSLIMVVISLIMLVGGLLFLMLEVVPYSKSVISGTVLLWIVFFAILYGVYYVIVKICRNNKAKRKIEFLETRLKIDSDKDLITSYRLDRELKMIYRILES